MLYFILSQPPESNAVPSVKYSPSRQTRALKNGGPFLIYVDSRKFHLVGFEGKDYDYYYSNKSTHPSVFAFLKSDYEE